jgi:signal transduction histidine kinase
VIKFASLVSAASLLAETTHLDSEQRNYVRVIRSSGEHLLFVLNHTLDFTKLQTGKLEIEANRVELLSMLEQAIQLSFKLNPKVELVYCLAPEVPSCILEDVTLA